MLPQPSTGPRSHHTYWISDWSRAHWEGYPLPGFLMLLNDKVMCTRAYVLTDVCSELQLFWWYWIHLLILLSHLQTLHVIVWASSLQGKPLQQNACTKTNMTISAVQMSILLWSDLQEMRARSQPLINARSTTTLSLKEGKRIRMHEFARMLTVLLHSFHDWIVMAELKNHRFKPHRPHRPHIKDDFAIACCQIVQSWAPDVMPPNMFC